MYGANVRPKSWGATDGGRILNATTKFYTGFIIAVAVVIAASFYAGFRAGYGAHAHRATASGRP